MFDEIKAAPAVIEFVKNSMLLRQFCRIAELCVSGCPIIPLKGMSLLLTLYKDDYSRNVGDMDLFIPADRIDYFTGKVHALGYKTKNPRQATKRIQSKGKFDMVNDDPRFCDLDIHVDLITKKFFRQTAVGFTSFALSRLHTIVYRQINIPLLSPVDEWLYLAQHYCFHLFSGEKWLKDLYLLQSYFEEKEIAELLIVAKRFHFKRVVTAVGHCLRCYYPADEIKIPLMDIGRNYLFKRLLRKPDIRFSRRLTDRIIAVYWEFLFIDRFASGMGAYIRLLFPGISLLCNIYNLPFPFTGWLLYPFHIIMVILSSILFAPLVIKKFAVYCPAGSAVNDKNQDTPQGAGIYTS
ncbi:MAG: nucleotidyltransferase family protein [Tannerellaceae bacterium]|jgi:hypothetical protein|nr:nucleotidyltransferase family protein [Tannerellaceae bacterium]